MSNACFSSDNLPSEDCKAPQRGQFSIPTGGPWVDIGTFKKSYKVTYFKYAAKIAYNIIYDNRESSNGPIWKCSCPDYKFNDRFENHTCCKHIQAVIDQNIGANREGGNYERFLVEHID